MVIDDEIALEWARIPHFYTASKYYLSGNVKAEHTQAYKSSDKAINIAERLCTLLNVLA